jgi:hypothetical protein
VERFDFGADWPLGNRGTVRFSPFWLPSEPSDGCFELADDVEATVGGFESIEIDEIEPLDGSRDTA